ncbi:MAG: hypothetical protein ACR2JW_18765 [Thermomicrobiales bacterium]
MNRYHLRRAIPAVIGGLVLAFVAFLPVTVPTADESGVHLPGIPTITPSTNSLGAAGTRPIGGLYGNIAAKQQFPAAGERIHSVALFLGTYRRTNRGDFQVAIQTNVAGEWKDLATRVVDKAGVTDNAYYTLTFSPPLLVAKGQPLQIVLTSADGAGDAITWWIDTSWQPQGYALAYKDTPQPGTALFLVSYAPDSGRLFQTLGPVWRRLTIFLDPLWQVVLILGFCVLAGSFVLLGRHLVT